MIQLSYLEAEVLEHIRSGSKVRDIMLAEKIAHRRFLKITKDLRKVGALHPDAITKIPIIEPSDYEVTMAPIVFVEKSFERIPTDHVPADVVQSILKEHADGTQRRDIVKIVGLPKLIINQILINEGVGQ